MKRGSLCLLFILVAFLLTVSCKNAENTVEGKTGPSGGIIFYDAGSVQTSTRVENGVEITYSWRYLEAAPGDLDGKYKYDEALTKCEEYSFGGKDDWFLPDSFKLNLLYTNLAQKGMGSFKDWSYYWSSDSVSETKAKAFIFKFDYKAATLSKKAKTEGCYVRPIRAYL